MARGRNNADAPDIDTAVEIAKAVIKDCLLVVEGQTESDLLATAYFSVDLDQRENFLYMLISESGCEDLPDDIRPDVEFGIECASKFSKTEFEALIKIWALAPELDEARPPELDSLVAHLGTSNMKKLVAGKLAWPRGKASGTDAARNIALHAAVNALIERGMTEGRGDTRAGSHCCKEGGSASDAAGVALTELGQGCIGFKRVQQVAAMPLLSPMWQIFPELAADLLGEPEPDDTPPG